MRFVGRMIIIDSRTQLYTHNFLFSLEIVNNEYGSIATHSKQEYRDKTRNLRGYTPTGRFQTIEYFFISCILFIKSLFTLSDFRRLIFETKRNVI